MHYLFQFMKIIYYLFQFMTVNPISIGRCGKRLILNLTVCARMHFCQRALFVRCSVALLQAIV